MNNLEEQLKGLIGSIIDEDIGRKLSDISAIKSVKINEQSCHINLKFNYAQVNSQQNLVNKIYEAIEKSDVKASMAEKNIKKVDIEIENQVIAHEVQNTDAKIQGVKNIIAVGSGKGGVGKSTVSSNLACALALEGANVAVLDADIYGPSQPRMMGVSGKPVSEDGKRMLPLISHLQDNIQIAVNSIGFLIEEDTPMIWRGPMVTQALLQLAQETHWNAHLNKQDIDYLIIDLPPGTGDIQLTLSQKIPVTAAIIVTTPQDIALLDAKKAYQMFQKVKIPVLGIIENMAYYQCPNCEHVDHIFGQHGGSEMAKLYDSEVLAKLPLDIHIREQADKGKASVIAEPQLESSKIYQSAARKIAAKLSLKKKNYKDIFPSIQLGASGGVSKGGLKVTKVPKS